MTLPPVLAVSFIAGLGVGAIYPALSSTVRAGADAPAPGGLLVAAIGLTPTLVVVGTAYLLTTMAQFTFPVWREMRRPGPLVDEPSRASTAA